MLSHCLISRHFASIKALSRLSTCDHQRNTRQYSWREKGSIFFLRAEAVSQEGWVIPVLYFLFDIVKRRSSPYRATRPFQSDWTIWINGLPKRGAEAHGRRDGFYRVWYESGRCPGIRRDYKLEAANKSMWVLPEPEASRWEWCRGEFILQAAYANAPRSRINAAERYQSARQENRSVFSIQIMEHGNGTTLVRFCRRRTSQVPCNCAGKTFPFNDCDYNI